MGKYFITLICYILGNKYFLIFSRNWQYHNTIPNICSTQTLDTELETLIDYGQLVLFTWYYSRIYYILYNNLGGAVVANPSAALDVLC